MSAGQNSPTFLKIQDIFHRVREAHIKPGAHRLQTLLGPQYFHTLSFAPVILVGGTNGKGSTCALLESILRHSGLKTGLYTSPHLVNVTERIRISGIPVFEKELLDTIEKLDTNRQSFLPDATFFELMTAASFILFYEKNVDVIVCEVGLGGRLDSTNVLNPMVSVLTGVSLDHTHILGKHVSIIAKDKSYIARRNKPFVVSTAMSHKALRTVVKTAQDRGVQTILTSQKLSDDLEKISAQFSFRQPNLRTALTVINCLKSNQISFHFKNKLTTANIRFGVQKTFWPGRFDVRTLSFRSDALPSRDLTTQSTSKKRTFIFDCAHNPDGVKFFLNAYSQSKFSNMQCNVLFASLADKDWRTNVSLLTPIAHSIEIIQIENERAQNANEIFAYLQSNFPQIQTNVSSKLHTAIERLKNNSHPVLVIGSIAFVGSVFEGLNLNVFPT